MRIALKGLCPLVQLHRPNSISKRLIHRLHLDSFLIQTRDGERREIRAGDVVWTPLGVEHWHGGTTEHAMVHLALQEAIDGQVVTWLEPVTDAEYLGTDEQEVCWLPVPRPGDFLFSFRHHQSKDQHGYPTSRLQLLH